MEPILDIEILIAFPSLIIITRIQYNVLIKMQLSKMYIYMVSRGGGEFFNNYYKDSILCVNRKCIYIWFREEEESFLIIIARINI